jgi:MFS family permease
MAITLSAWLQNKQVQSALVGLFGLIVVPLIWPFLQSTVGMLVPAWLFTVTSFTGPVGIVGVVIGTMVGLLPASNRWRRLAYGLAILSFLINLLGMENIGSVAVQAALGAQVWLGLLRDWKRSEPINLTKKKVAQGVAWIIFGFGMSWLMFNTWPVTDGTEILWDGFQVIGYLGAIALFIGVNIVETGRVAGDSVAYRTTQVLGRGAIVVSFLGQFNPSGLILNSAILIIAGTTIVWDLLMIWLKKPAGQVGHEQRA